MAREMIVALLVAVAVTLTSAQLGAPGGGGNVQPPVQQQQNPFSFFFPYYMYRNVFDFNPLMSYFFMNQPGYGFGGNQQGGGGTGMFPINPLFFLFGGGF